NSMYCAETAFKIWQNKSAKPHTTLDKIQFYHQIAALSVQIYKTFQLFNSAPDLQPFFRNNYDLLAPVYQAVMELLTQSDWSSTFQTLDITKTAGNLLGQGINLLQPGQEKPKYTSSIVQVLINLPYFLHEIASLIDKNTLLPTNELTIKQRKAEALGAVFEYLFSAQGSFTAIFDGPAAISAFKEIQKNINTQNNRLQKNSVVAHQHWMERYYPILLIRIDAIEALFDISPGLLSRAIIAEIDPVNDKLNEQIEDDFKGRLNYIPLSSDLAPNRAIALEQYKRTIRIELFKAEQQLKICSTKESKSINQKRSRFTLKIAIIDTALYALGEIKAETPQKNLLTQLRSPITNQEVYAQDLKDALENPSEPTRHVRGNLSYLQNLKLSELSLFLKNDFSLITTIYLSNQVLPYLTKPIEASYYSIKADDPNLVRQIKRLENSLTRFSTALIHFEQMNIHQSIPFQIQAFFSMRYQVFDLMDDILEIPVDLKTHYEPLIKDLIQLKKVLLSFHYNKEDLSEFQSLLKDTKKEVLKKRIQRERDKVEHNRPVN
ncbi:MAG: hypothetical protein ACHP6H_06395, partial [Legionellales bacterium]